MLIGRFSYLWPAFYPCLQSKSTSFRTFLYYTTLVLTPKVFESELLKSRLDKLMQAAALDASCVNVVADFLLRAGPSAYSCLLFLLLFSLGIPVWEVPPLVWGSLWHPAALLSFHQPAGCLWKVRLLSGHRLWCEGPQCCGDLQGLAGSP